MVARAWLNEPTALRVLKAQKREPGQPEAMAEGIRRQIEEMDDDDERAAYYAKHRRLLELYGQRLHLLDARDPRLQLVRDYQAGEVDDATLEQYRALFLSKIATHNAWIQEHARFGTPESDDEPDETS